MAKPEKPPPPPSEGERQILQVLIMIFLATGRQNRILRQTEAGNERRHKELLAALSGPDNPNASKVVFTKVRREPIPKT